MIPAEQWQRCRPWIEAALDTCVTHGIEDIEAGIVSGLYQFWPGKRCAIVTEIATFPKGRVLNIWLLGGDLKELMQMRPHVEAWGKAQGCKWADGFGRPGWGRVLGKHGYRAVGTSYSKGL